MLILICLVTLRNAQNNLEVKRTEFQQIGADLGAYFILLYLIFTNLFSY